MQLTTAQEVELAAVAQSYSSAIQGLQQHAQSLCEQLKVALADFAARSHVSMQVFEVSAALQDCLEEQHECGLQVVRQVCLQASTEFLCMIWFQYKSIQRQMLVVDVSGSQCDVKCRYLMLWVSCQGLMGAAET